MYFTYDEKMRIVFVILLIAISVVCAYYLSNRTLLSNSSQESVYNLRENFENENSETSNLIKNGDLKDGKDITGAIPDNSSIVKLNKNKIGKYAVAVKRGGHYMVGIPVEEGQTYILTLWCCDKGGNKSYNQVDGSEDKLKNIVDFEMKKKQGNEKTCIQFHYKKINTFGDNNDTMWIQYEFNISIPTNVIGNLNIYLGFNTPSLKYFTNIEMKKIFDKIPDFTDTKGLKVLLLPNETNKLNDLSKNGHSFTSNSSIKFINKKGINIHGKTLTGSSKQLIKPSDGNQIKQFTIVCGLNILKDIDGANILSIPGNQDKSLHITTHGGKTDNDVADAGADDTSSENTNTNNYLTAKIGDDTSRYDSPPHILKGDNVYTIVYNKDHISFYLNKNSSPFWSFKTPSKLYFSSPITLNEGGSLNAELYGFMMYDRVLSERERINVVKYLDNYEQTSTQSRMEDYMFQSCLPLSSSTHHNSLEYTTNTKTANSDDIDLGGVVLDMTGGGYNGTKKFKNNVDSNNTKAKINSKYNPLDDLELDITVGGNDGGGSGPSNIPSGGGGGGGNNSESMCLDSAIENCSKNTQHKDTYAFLGCLNKAKIDNPNCYSYCNKYKDIADKDKPKICQTLDLKHVQIQSDCPKVYQKDGDYYVHVPENSHYGSKYNGQSITKNYGSSKDIARKVFIKNYPKCVIPEILKKNSHVDHNKCPYIIDEGNPCRSSACSGVNWSAKNMSDAGLSDDCRLDINTYCTKNAYTDPKCACWTDEKYNEPKCQAHRRQFQHPKDNKSLPGDHPIESHPDYTGYIKKSDIPCWNCNLE